jgi:UDP-GlcNAc:undecaprenyl-phosphate/decaprenyl-phosphate GlcNAc-1-phosphate transferase
MQQAVYILLLALFISMVLVPPLARLAGPLGLTDRPGARKIHQQPIPRSGGIAIVIGALIPIVFLVTARQDVRAFLIAAGVLFVFGVLDDRFDLDYRIKLLGQISAAAIVAVGGGVLIESLPFFDADALPRFIGLPLTLFVIIAITNAVNLSDGLDGLAGGISLLALVCLSILAYQGDDPAALGIALAMIGATFGFLRFNSNPAQIFMGDTGSQFLGFGTAVLIILVTQRLDTVYGQLMPILIVGIPVLDTATVMIRRIRAGLSPFRPDRSHLHHRLLSLGWTQYQAVVFIYVAQALMVLAAYLMRFASDLAVLMVYLTGALALLWLVHGLLLRVDRCALAESTGTKANRILIGARSRWILDKIDHTTDVLGRVPYPMLRTLVPVTLLAGAILATDVDTDVGWLAAIRSWACSSPGCRVRPSVTGWSVWPPMSPFRRYCSCPSTRFSRSSTLVCCSRSS